MSVRMEGGGEESVPVVQPLAARRIRRRRKQAPVCPEVRHVSTGFDLTLTEANSGEPAWARSTRNLTPASYAKGPFGAAVTGR